MRAAWLVTAVLAAAVGAVAAPARPTVACGPPTPSQTEGPYFKAGSPLRRSIAPAGAPGARLVLTGRVLTVACKPVARAVLDFWQADSTGAYDNAGYRFRGHQLTDARGRYRLETVVPGLYPGRTRHIHVKVRAPGRPGLTTQLYFPGTSANDGDGIFDPRLLVRGWRKSGSRRLATFTFVVQTS